MTWKPPQYNGKDNLVMLLVAIPVTIIINSLFFGSQYFSGPGFFLYTTAVSFIAFIFYFIVCGTVAITYRKHYPSENQLLKRLSVTIITFLLMTGLFIYSLFRGYEMVGMYDIHFREAGFVWGYFAMGIINIFLTFLMEGISRYKDWRENMKETEKINAAYKQSQLNGLKSQVNPHFLFNSLNSLSSLIQEDEEKAEKFLDEMSKVYRYMLRNDDEQLVTLETELRFLSAYLYLLQTRYGSGLQVKLHINDNCMQKLLAPLTLQVVIENTFTQNIVSRNNPLLIDISNDATCSIVFKNKLQPKVVTDTLDFEAGLDNLVKKYALLGKPITVNEKSEDCRIVCIPLINQEEVAV